MSRFPLLFVVSLATGSVVSLAAGPALAQNKAENNVAMVNDKAISKATGDQFIQKLGQPDTPELRDRIKEQLIEREVFVQEATKRGITQRPDAKVQLDFVRNTAIIQHLTRDEAKSHAVTDP